MQTNLLSSTAKQPAIHAKHSESKQHINQITDEHVAFLMALAQLEKLANQRFRILVVDDNQTNRFVAASMVKMAGYTCETADSGREAVERACTGEIDIILMDCEMPGMDGYKATAHIRAHELAIVRRTVIVAMTGNMQDGDAKKCLDAGMNDYLAKPITVSELCGKLATWRPSQRKRHFVAPAIERDEDEVSSPLDLATFHKLGECMGTELPRLLLDYLDNAPQYLNWLEQAVRDNDPRKARAHAHAFKGSSFNLGAKELCQLCQEAEDHAIAQRLELVHPLLPRLRTAYHAVADLLATILVSFDDTGAFSRKEMTRVLIVDDDQDIRNTVGMTLKRSGFIVEEAADGLHALAAFKRFQPDLVLMDAIMPVMDGFTACARLRELAGETSIPVVMVTALRDQDSVARARQAGAIDCVAKPVNDAELTSLVKRILEATASRT